MSISTLVAFTCGLTTGFVVGVLLAEKGKVGSQDLTNISSAAISKVKTAVSYLKNHEYTRQSQNSHGASQA